jgi:excisionase family DNA binding protein
MKVQDYMSVLEAAEKWNITVRQVQKICSTGKIPDAIRFGRSWAIPKETEKPTITRRTKPGLKKKSTSSEQT